MLTISIGLMVRPKILLIDEPSSGLAPALVKHMLGIIKQIREAGLTILLVEQNVQAALKVADRGYVLENGRVVLEGDSQILRNHKHVKKAYLGKE